MNSQSKRERRALSDPSQAPASSAPPKESTRRTRGARDRDAGHPTEHTSLWSRVGFLIRRLHQIHVAMFMAALAEHQMTPVQYGLLSVLVEMPGLDQFSVAEELGIDRANVHDVLKRLEARKLLVRVVDPNNKRRKICLATPQGAKLVVELHPLMQAAQDRLVEPLTGAERVTFKALLHKLIEANSEHGRAVLRLARTKRGDPLV